MRDSIYKKLISIYFFFVTKLRKNRRPERIMGTFNISMYDFCTRLNLMPYRYDYLHGFLDSVADPDTFFDKKDHGRDCDDFARMWSWWLTINDYEAVEYCVANPDRLFSTLHMITIGHKNDEYWLMNYYYYGPFKSEQEALDYMRKFNSYKNNMIYVRTPVKFK